MRALSIVIAVVTCGCATVEAGRAGSSAQSVDSSRLPPHYMPCGLPSSENMVRCFETAKAACPSGFTVRGPFPDLNVPGLVYVCN